MNIEEESIEEALMEGASLLKYIHLADSNRLQPGWGHTDFGKGFAVLKSIGYDGWLTIESGAQGDIKKALKEVRELIMRLWNVAK